MGIDNDANKRAIYMYLSIYLSHGDTETNPKTVNAD
jgi:hypothetical protein